MVYILYLLLLAIDGVVKSASGIKVDTWQYWVLLCCILGAHITGTML